MPEPTYKIAQRLLASRAAVGVKQYGDDLTANSPGCMIVHALEEAADQVNYLIAEIQRRKYVIEKLESLAEEMRADKAPRWAFEMEKLSDLLGGPSALKQYDEILGGGTVAENATVDPLSDPAISTLHKFATTELPQIETITTSGSLPIDPRDEALRVAEKALALVCYNEDRVTGFDHLIHRMDMEACKEALAAIRGAR